MEKEKHLISSRVSIKKFSIFKHSFLLKNIKKVLFKKKREKKTGIYILNYIDLSKTYY